MYPAKEGMIDQKWNLIHFKVLHKNQPGHQTVTGKDCNHA